MAVFANDHIGQHIFAYGLYEKYELETLFEFLEPLTDELSISTAFDIGSNIGNHSIYFSRKFKAVHAFEPNPSTYEILRLNSFYSKNIFPHNIAVGERAGTLELFEDTYNNGASYIKEEIENGDHEKTITINAKSLDEIDIDYSNLGLVKIDVEGFEEKVIRGALTTIQKYHPIVVLEQRKDEFVNEKTESMKLLEKYSYKFCWYERGSDRSSAFLKLTERVLELFRGRSHRILTGENIPPVTHHMLIAIPPRFQKALGLV